MHWSHLDSLGKYHGGKASARLNRGVQCCIHSKRRRIFAPGTLHRRIAANLWIQCKKVLDQNKLAS